MSLILYKATRYPYSSHEEKLIEYFAVVNTTGAILSGGEGLTISKSSAGTYDVIIDNIHPIYAADLTDTSLAANKNGTGVTKTCSVFVNTLTTFPVNTFCFGFAENITLTDEGQITFFVKTTEGGALVDNVFSLKIVVTCEAYGRN